MNRTLMKRAVMVLIIIVGLPLSVIAEPLPAGREQSSSSTRNVEKTVSQLRPRYQQWLNSYQTLNIDEQEHLLAELKNYPLYPYAKLQFLQNNISTVSVNQVLDFVKHNQDLPLTAQFIPQFLGELTKRQDWDNVINLAITFYGTNLSTTNMSAHCYYQYALYQQTLKAPSPELTPILATVKSWWLTGKELPSVCDPLLDLWQDNGQKTDNLILLRIGLATQQNNINLARYITNQLSPDYKTVKTALVSLFDDPRNLGDFSRKITASPFTRQIVLATFPRLVKRDNKTAEKLLPTLIKTQRLSKSERITLEQSLANSYFTDVATDRQKSWRDNFITQHGNTALIEKRIRLAISENSNVSHWLERLPPQDQQKDEWQYLQAEMLLKQNKKSEAEAILAQLATKRGFYGMISAQKLQQPYLVTGQSEQLLTIQQQNEYADLPVIKRITELRYFGLLAESTREWRYYLTHQADSTDYLDLARYCYQLGFGDLAIQATIAGKLWDNWRERLPVMYQDSYQKALSDKAIPLSYALAISRQESALDPTVQSPVGASGLMQLMPATAKDSAAKMGLTNYNNSLLFNPDINIQIGTYYLNSLYSQNGNNRILASAAYNAGPNRVKQWLNSSGGKLSAIAFIETVPFAETRNYIKNVLVYDAIYQHFLAKSKMDKIESGILTQSELNRFY